MGGARVTRPYQYIDKGLDGFAVVREVDYHMVFNCPVEFNAGVNLRFVMYPTNCPNCGAPSDLGNAKDNGMVKCGYCGTWIQGKPMLAKVMAEV